MILKCPPFSKGESVLHGKVYNFILVFPLFKGGDKYGCSMNVVLGGFAFNGGVSLMGDLY